MREYLTERLAMLQNLHADMTRKRGELDTMLARLEGAIGEAATALEHAKAQPEPAPPPQPQPPGFIVYGNDLLH